MILTGELKFEQKKPSMVLRLWQDLHPCLPDSSWCYHQLSYEATHCMEAGHILEGALRLTMRFPMILEFTFNWPAATRFKIEMCISIIYSRCTQEDRIDWLVHLIPYKVHISFFKPFTFPSILDSVSWQTVMYLPLLCPAISSNSWHG